MGADVRVLLAPDKFKGTMTAAEVADAIAAGLRDARSDVAITVLPIADGGDGTLAVALDRGFEPLEVQAADALGNPATAVIGVRGQHAIVELASICGMQRLPDRELQPEHATTIGLGLAVRAALDHGCTRITIGLGGSASTDGGAGLLCGLGARLLDADRNSVPPVPDALERVTAIDTSGLDPRLTSTVLEVAIDVDAPLLGAHGAATVFGPQKGANAAIVSGLERAMKHWADLLSKLDSHPDPTHPGAGAAGGTAFAALALGAELFDGADVLLDLVDFDTAATEATLVITGEGRLDRQTLMGKAPVVVARRAHGLDRPVVAVVGSRDERVGDEVLNECGFDAVYELLDVDPRAASDLGVSRAGLVTLGAHIARVHLPAPNPGPSSPLSVSAGSTSNR